MASANKMKKGFTLIEVFVLVVVLSIIGFSILASIGKGIPKEALENQGTLGNLTADFPEPTNYAVDTAGALTPEELTNLNTQLKEMDTDKHQFAVAIVKTTYPLDIEQYGIKLAEKWKVGRVGLDNGAIVIIATQDRKVRIEVGSGLEGDLNDAKAGDVIRNDMSPLLKDSKWYEAVSAALKSINRDIE